MDLEKLAKGWDFADQTVVIPGGAGILGSEMAWALVKCRANVVILDRDLSKADALKKRLSEGPGSASCSSGCPFKGKPSQSRTSSRGSSAV